MTKVLRIDPTSGYPTEVDIVSGGAAGVGLITLDFGSIPLRFKKFTGVAFTSAVGERLIILASTVMPGTLSADELEMDMLVAAGRVTATNTIEVIVTSIEGQITGQRNFNVVRGI